MHIHQSTHAMTEKPSYEELERQLAETKAKLEKAKKTEKTYVQKNIDDWKKFLDGQLGLLHFKRSSRSEKTKSKFQYFFTRGGKKCFQYKDFVKDLLEAICEKEGLSKQRLAMMRLELRKSLQARPQEPGQKKPSKAQEAEEGAKPVARVKEEAQETKDHTSPLVQINMAEKQFTAQNMMAMSLEQLLKLGSDFASTLAVPHRRELVKVFHQKGGSARMTDLQRSLGVRTETLTEDLTALGLSA